MKNKISKQCEFWRTMLSIDTKQDMYDLLFEDIYHVFNLNMVSILIYLIKITAVLKKYINYEYNYSYLQRIVYSKIEATVQIDFILYVLCNFIRLFDEFST